MHTINPPKFCVISKRKNKSEMVLSLYLRISFENKTFEKSIGIQCDFDDWVSEHMLIKNSKSDTKELKQRVDELTQKIMGAYYLFSQEESYFSLKDIVDVAVKNRKPGSLSFVQCFNDIIKRMENALGQEGNSETNLQKHRRCLVHFQVFCKRVFKSSDVSFQKITRSTIEELGEYFKGDGKCSHNTAMKYMQIIKKVYRMAMDNGWVKINAFANFKFRIRMKDRQFLTEDDLKSLLEKKFEIRRLEYVKDMFLFSCFSGLAYIDLKNLKRSNLSQSNERFWIKSKRTKTGIEASIPLLGPAKEIIEKYRADWQNISNDECIFYLISNQKMNEYLKEIAIECSITKPITFHLARHTFATTVALCNDVPLETVSKMLGHSRITMTQHYSKVVDKKIVRDTEKLFQKY